MSTCPCLGDREGRIRELGGRPVCRPFLLIEGRKNKSMTTRKPGAGDVIGAHCTRCREVRNHTIVAMVGEKVVRVECNTCGGVHNYKAPAAARPPKTATAGRVPAGKSAGAPRPSRRDPGAADRAEWEESCRHLAVDRAIPYDMTRSYRVGDLVAHPAFGLGLVKSLGSNKIEVLFQEGKKLLRSG